MEEYLKVVEFNNPDRLNIFLKDIGRRAVSCTPYFDPRLNYVKYLVVYWMK